MGSRVPGRRTNPCRGPRHEPGQHFPNQEGTPRRAWLERSKGPDSRCLNSSLTDPLVLCWSVWPPSQNHGMHGWPIWHATITRYTLKQLSKYWKPKSCDVKSKCFFNTFCGRSEVAIWHDVCHNLMGCGISVIFIDHKATSTAHTSKIFCITQWDARFHLEVVKIPIPKSQILWLLPSDPQQPGPHHTGLMGHSEALGSVPWGAAGESESTEVGWSCCFRETGFEGNRSRRVRRQPQWEARLAWESSGTGEREMWMCSRCLPEEPTGRSDPLPAGHRDEERHNQDGEEGVDRSRQALWDNMGGSCVTPVTPGLRGGPGRVGHIACTDGELSRKQRIHSLGSEEPRAERRCTHSLVEPDALNKSGNLRQRERVLHQSPQSRTVLTPVRETPVFFTPPKVKKLDEEHLGELTGWGGLGSSISAPLLFPAWCYFPNLIYCGR